MRLGHYALPKLDKDIVTTKKKVKGYEVTIIDNGKYQLAIVPLLGWDKSEVVSAKGLNSESEESTVINVVANTSTENESNIYATLMLWKKSDKKWKKRELLSVKNIELSKDSNRVSISFEDNKKKVVSYN
tara:strand:+ start:86 stop:475 length:390 start_codon:yes stop_codon:yes gene_type:complete